MAQWGKNDDAANSVFWASALVRQKETTANQTSIYNNANADSFITGTTDGQYGVSTGEQAASRANTGGSHAAHSGWVLRREGSGGRAGRVQYEVLVTSRSITGDGADDSVFPDYTINITSQPADDTSNTGDPVTFTVVASITPSDGTLVYTWEVDGGVGVWAPISDGGVYSTSNTATLTISDNTGLNGNVYHVIIQATGAANVTSANASITEV